ncbi:MAG: hypothetical protein ACMUIP_06125 [bacterium]
MKNEGYEKTKNKRKKKHIFLWLFFTGLVVSVLTGCGGNALEGIADDTSYVAQIEEARIALDQEDYARAHAILVALNSERPNDPLILRYLSNASAGLVGLNTFDLLETMSSLEESGSEGDIDMIGLTLGDDEGIITQEQIASKSEGIATAIELLEQIENPTDDEIVQEGVLSMNHAVLTIAQIITLDTDADTIELTEEGLNEIYPEGNADLSDVQENPTAQAALVELSQDITRIAESIDTIETVYAEDSENDLSDNFSEFKAEIDPDDDNTITWDELQAYINTRTD